MKKKKFGRAVASLSSDCCHRPARALLILVLTLSTCYGQHAYRTGGQSSSTTDNKHFNVDDEPSNLCTGEFMGQLSCNRATNVVQNVQNQLELRASINRRAKESFFLFDGARIFTEHGWTTGSATVRALQPSGRFLRSMIGLRTLLPNGVDWDRAHSSSIVFAQQTDTLLYKLYDRNSTSVATQLWSKKVRRFRNLQSSFANYTVVWSPTRVVWSINGQQVESHTFLEPNRKWHLTIQLGVGGPEFTELRDLLPDTKLNWERPAFTIEDIDLNVHESSVTSSSHQSLSSFLSCLLFILTAIRV